MVAAHAEAVDVLMAAVHWAAACHGCDASGVGTVATQAEHTQADSQADSHPDTRWTIPALTAAVYRDMQVCPPPGLKGSSCAAGLRQ